VIERPANIIDGAWRPSRTAQALDVLNPASAQVLAEVPLSPSAEVRLSAEAAGGTEWSSYPDESGRRALAARVESQVLM